jgi:hypothetical protein
MATLYKRATPRQAMVLGIVEGAVKNEAHAHGRKIDPRQARSIAKRAAGTLIAAWPSVLASPAGWSDSDSHKVPHGVAGVVSVSTRSTGRSFINRPGDALTTLDWRIPIRRIAAAIGAETGNAKRLGNAEREAALIDVLRLLAEVVDMETPPQPATRLTVKMRDRCGNCRNRTKSYS